MERPISAALQPPPAVVPVMHWLPSYLASLAVIAFALVFYTRLSAFHIALYSMKWTPHTNELTARFTLDMPRALITGALLYAIWLIPYYQTRPGQPSNAAMALRYGYRLLRRTGAWQPSAAEHQALLCLLLKFMFIPFCINGLIAYLACINNDVLTLLSLSPPHGSAAWFDFYNRHLHFFLLNFILAFDFFPFVIGYLMQSKSLGNEIISVDASLLGWIACLACYPPFNTAFSQFMPWQVTELVPAYPTFPAALHIVLNLMLLTCFGIYASASVALGFKCSNLTNRGTVTRGPYQWVRHPAYVFKNLAWWLAAMPVLIRLAAHSPLDAFWGMCCLAGWTGIYGLRAVTEERHLLRIDTGYAAYMKRVPYRFVRGVL